MSDIFACYKVRGAGPAGASFALGMTPIPNGLSIGDYRERLSGYKDAENEKNAMIIVSCHETLIFFVPLTNCDGRNSSTIWTKLDQSTDKRLWIWRVSVLGAADSKIV